MAELAGQEQVFIIGGADIYSQTIGIVDRMILTRVEGVFQGDKFFPPIGPEWAGAARMIDGAIMQESNDYRFSIWDYVRVPA
jgi:dihydrofolate reductase